jgi:NAD(P)H-flavin reductase
MSKRVEAVIVNKEKVNHDCYIYSFEYVHEPIHFTIGQHFKIIQ